jgi:hypothetical protein
VEAGPESLSISIRTDVAWYRLVKPTEKYTAWFNPVLKVWMVWGVDPWCGRGRGHGKPAARGDLPACTSSLVCWVWLIL